MNLKFYIESGILEQYAMGLLNTVENTEVERLLDLYVALREELERIQEGMENYAMLKAVQPKSHVKDLVVDTIVNLQKEKAMNINDLPLINKYSDYQNWLNLIATFTQMPLDNDGKFVKVLRHDEKVTQMFVFSTTAIEEEIHQDEEESFLILSGQCRCTIAGEVQLMEPGDFMAIPLHQPHNVTLISKTVTAILQRIKI